jgi:hypothetical protein
MGAEVRMRRGAGPRALALAALVAGCGLFDTASEQSQSSPMRQAIIDTWRGVDLAVLLQHPLFAYRQPHVVMLQNGVESWVYSTCWSDAAGGWVQVNQQMMLASPGAYESCCHSQFFIAARPGGGKQVLEYRPVGCNTNCTAAATGCGPQPAGAY